MKTWIPDTCPDGTCEFEIAPDPAKPDDGDHGQLVKPLRLCPHHQKVKKDHAIDDHGLLDAMKQTSRAKESARSEMAKALGVEHSHDIPFTVAADGALMIGRNKFGVSARVSAADASAKSAARTNVATALKSVRAPKGTARIELVGLD
jgi:hypothetical protein